MNTTKITALIKLTGLVSWNSLIVIDASSCDQGPGCLLVTWWGTDMSWRFWMNETLIMSLIETDTVSILRGRLWKSLRSQRSKSSRPSQSLGSGRSGKPAALRISPFAQSAHPVTISFHTVWYGLQGLAVSSKWRPRFVSFHRFRAQESNAGLDRTDVSHPLRVVPSSTPHGTRRWFLNEQFNRYQCLEREPYLKHVDSIYDSLSISRISSFVSLSLWNAKSFFVVVLLFLIQLCTMWQLRNTRWGREKETKTQFQGPGR